MRWRKGRIGYNSGRSAGGSWPAQRSGFILYHRIVANSLRRGKIPGLPVGLCGEFPGMGRTLPPRHCEAHYLCRLGIHASSPGATRVAVEAAHAAIAYFDLGWHWKLDCGLLSILPLSSTGTYPTRQTYS